MKRLGGHGRCILACSAVSSIALNAGYAISFSSIAIRDLEAGISSVHLTINEAAWFGSLLPLMAMCGSLLSGPIMDHLGRRPAVLTVVVCFLTSWIAMLFSAGHAMLFAGRGLSGLATGMSTAVIPVYISEISPAFLRGAMGGLFSVALAIGLPLGYSADLFCDWMQVAELGAVLACLTFIVAYMLRESPYWLIRQGRVTEATKCLRNLRCKGYNVAGEVKEIHCLQEELSVPVTMREVASRIFLKPLGIGVALMLFQQLSGVNAIFYYAHDIFRRANFHNETLASILVSSMQVCALTAVTFFMDKVGRKKLLLLSSFGMTICHVVVGACLYVLPDTSATLNENVYPEPTNSYNTNVVGSFDLSAQPSTNEGLGGETKPESELATWLSLVFVMLYIASYGIGLGPVPFIALSEMLPQRGRGVAGGVVTMSNWLCAFVVTKTFTDLVDLISVAGVFLLFAFVCSISSLFVWQCMPEMRGKTLSEIQGIFKGNNNDEKFVAKHAEASMMGSSRIAVDGAPPACPLIQLKTSYAITEKSPSMIS